MVGQSERVIRRRIRDRLDREKLARGAMAQAGLSGVADDIEATLRGTASSS
jgi:hypothetical protein